MKAILFPGQGSQTVGMAKNHFESDETVKKRFEEANELLGYSITEIMFDGPADRLKQTKFTQPAIFLHSVALFESLDITADVVAGHSLGEFTALASIGAIPFSEALKLVSLRGELMQKAGESNPGTMAAVIGMDDGVVDEICNKATDIIGKPVVAANYNCPGQLVISGDLEAVDKAIELAKEQGCRLAKKLPVSGAFHSPLMQPALEGLKNKLDNINFKTPVCPIYSNVTAEPTTDPATIKQNLVDQLISPVRWTQTLENMSSNGIEEFVEVGPGKVLQGLVKRTVKTAKISGHE